MKNTITLLRKTSFILTNDFGASPALVACSQSFTFEKNGRDTRLTSIVLNKN
ncbi:hypothetical protein [Ekhidna sp.]